MVLITGASSGIGEVTTSSSLIRQFLYIMGPSVSVVLVLAINPDVNVAAFGL